ncbi:MAG: pyridoxal phosphate-dependent aminotransferase [Clostridiales bacterium]|nr:pyridoxal phosphate-dependent aminotransferase [Clostridiales bacterium]
MNEFEKKYYADRVGTGSVKWDGLQFLFGDKDLISMWVADMDFRSPECVGEALKSMADTGLFGYFMPPREYFETFINWEQERHGCKVEQEWIKFSPGVVAGIFHFVGAFTQPGDSCIILSPCYYPFMEAVKDTGRNLVCSILKNNNGAYTIDFEDFEKKIKDNDVKLFILCSPHNPVGRVWTKEELCTLVDICRRNGVIIVSDEIHQDIVLSGNKHIPTLASCDCGDMVVSLTAASKTFNLAAFNHSIAVIPSKELRDKYDEYQKHMHISGAMPGYVAVRAAYEGGKEWLDNVIKQIETNVKVLTDILTEGAPECVITKLQGTYLQWIDLSAYVKPDELKDFVVKECKLAVDYGSQFFTPEEGKEDCHIRLNLATSEENVRKAAENIVRAIKNR